MTAVEMRRQVQMLQLLRLWMEPGNAGKSYAQLAKELGTSDDTIFRLIGDPTFTELFQAQFQGPMMQALAKLGDNLLDVIDRQIQIATGKADGILTLRDETEASRALQQWFLALTQVVRDNAAPAVNAMAGQGMMTLRVHTVGNDVTLQIGRRQVEAPPAPEALFGDYEVISPT